MSVPFLPGWNNRKQKIINGTTAGAQTNYQMKLKVIKSSFQTSNNATGGTITESGGYRIHTFTVSGIFTPLNNMEVEILVVGGGGGGGQRVGGGGGSGGVVYVSNFFINTTAKTITVGNGGNGANANSTLGQQGSSSSFDTGAIYGKEILAEGGGGGSSYNRTPGTGGNGGSGGGGSFYGASPGIGGIKGNMYLNNYANNGGNSINGAQYGGGGGGGTGSVGINATATVAGNGGSGKEFSQFSSAGVGSPSGWFAGGGGAGASGGTAGTGSNGGGNGKAGINLGVSDSGLANTGSGGGGGSDNSGGTQSTGGNGGSGVIIIRYIISPTEPDNQSIYISECNDDFSDVRFTKSDGITLLNYWIQYIQSGLYAIVWVQIDNIPANPDTTIIYIYYNNPTEPSLSNGNNTFPLSDNCFFDDFLGSSLSASWVCQATSTFFGVGSCSVANSILTTTGGTNTWWGAYSNGISGRSPPFSIEFSSKWIKDDPAANEVGASDTGNLNTPGDSAHVMSDGSGYINSKNNILTASGDVVNLKSFFYNIRIDIYSNVKYYINTTLKYTITTNIPTNALRIIISAAQTTGQTLVDWVFIRHFIFPEPTPGNTGAEEQPTTSIPILGSLYLSIERGITLVTGTVCGRRRLRNR